MLRFSIVFSVVSHGFLWVPMHARQPISFLSRNPLFLCAVLSWFRSFLWVFWGISSCFGRHPVCSRCFPCVSDVFRSQLLPPIAQSARCACQKPKDTTNPFTNTPRFGLLTHMLGSNFDTTFLGEFSVIHPLASCIPEITGFANRFPKLSESYNVPIILSLVFDPGFDHPRFPTVVEPVYSRALFQSELVQNGSRRA